MSTIVHEGMWDCSNCGMTKIPGSKKACPRCEDPQNSVLTPSEDWYLPENARQITDPAELAKANAGPAWNCGHCGVQNDGDAEKCSQCNRPRDFDDTVNRRVVYDDMADDFDTKPDPRDEMIESDLAKAKRTIATEANGPRTMGDLKLHADDLPTIGTDTEFYEGIREGVNRDFDEAQHRAKQPPVIRWASTHRKLLIIGAVILAVLLIIGIVIGTVRAVHNFTATVSGTVTVSELHWERSVEVEEYKTLTDEGWSHPGDARILGSETRIQSYRTVHDGWRTERYTENETRYRDETYMGSDTRTRSVPYTYDCSYKVSNGNGSFSTISRTCTGTRSETYQVPAQKTRRVPYQVPVEKTRQVEINHQEPVFGTWYHYQVDRWMTDRWVTATDTTSAKVAWPEPSDLSRNGQSGDQVGEERVGDERKAAYAIIYIDSRGASHSEKSDRDDVWAKLEKGEAVPARYLERSGELKSVDWSAVK